MRRFALVGMVMLGAAGCGDDAVVDSPPDPPEEPGPCAASEVEVAGACVAVGVPVDGCEPGFMSDEAGGCVAVLPADVCGPGTVAVPGDTACAPLAECGEGTWGNIPLEAGAEHVDPGYLGGDSDGSAAKPWPTVQAALGAAVAGEMIALAAGTYPPVVIDEPVRLWGRCPTMVAFEGGLLAIDVATAGMELRQVAITSPTAGLLVEGSPDTLVDAVWIHDTAAFGIDVGDAGEINLHVRGSLIESATDLGILVHGAHVVLESSVIRGTQPTPQGIFGGAIEVQAGFMQPVAGQVEIRNSLLELNHDVALLIVGGHAQVVGSVIRDTLPSPDGRFGRGIDLSANPVTDVAASAALVGSVVERNHDISIFVAGADLSLDRATVVGTLPQQLTGTFGRGVQIQHRPELMRRGALTATSSLIEGSHDGALVVANADAAIDHLLVRDVRPRASDGLFGDGIAIARSVIEDAPVEWAAASATIATSRIDHASRAGVSAFGATVGIRDTQLSCNVLHLDAEAEDGVEAQLDDQGGNRCGCDGELVECKILTSSLEPPTPIP